MLKKNYKDSVRESYDNLAEEYARRFCNELQSKPMDRELLDRFVSDVRAHGDVYDMGCGPGHVTRYLKDAGARVFGVDLSARMIMKARQLHPDIEFQIGNMMALDLPDATVAGIVAFYAIVNIPKQFLSLVFREMARVLQPEGLILLSFPIGNEISHFDELWGEPVSLDFFFFQPTEIRRELEAAGLSVENIIERKPYTPEVEYQSRRAYIFARKKACNVGSHDTT